MKYVSMYANIDYMKREIIFYEKENGRCPVEEFLNNLEIKIVKKIAWTFKIIEEKDIVPKTYFKKLESTDGIWEIRIKFGSNIYRIFSFLEKNNLIVLTHGIIKKSQKTPAKEIKQAEEYRRDYLRRKNNEPR